MALYTIVNYLFLILEIIHPKDSLYCLSIKIKAQYMPGVSKQQTLTLTTIVNILLPTNKVQTKYVIMHTEKFSSNNFKCCK